MQGVFSFLKATRAAASDAVSTQTPRPTLRDFQRQKLYRFEERYLMTHPLNAACLLYTSPSPRD